MLVMTWLLVVTGGMLVMTWLIVVTWYASDYVVVTWLACADMAACDVDVACLW
jgi:hypothetical protein